MARRLNAGDRNALQAGLSLVRRDLERATAEVTGARSEQVRDAAVVLRDSWRDVLDVREKSAAPPGQPPHRHRGRLRTSVKYAVVGGVMRVGSGSGIARFLEFGVNATAKAPRRFDISKQTARKERHRRTVVARGQPYQLVILPRPHAAAALARATPRMTDVYVSSLQQGLASRLP